MPDERKPTRRRVLGALAATPAIAGASMASAESEGAGWAPMGPPSLAEQRRAAVADAVASPVPWSAGFADYLADETVNKASWGFTAGLAGSWTARLHTWERDRGRDDRVVPRPRPAVLLGRDKNEDLVFLTTRCAVDPFYINDEANWDAPDKAEWRDAVLSLEQSDPDWNSDPSSSASPLEPDFNFGRVWLDGDISERPVSFRESPPSFERDGNLPLALSDQDWTFMRRRAGAKILREEVGALVDDVVVLVVPAADHVWLGNIPSPSFALDNPIQAVRQELRARKNLFGLDYTLVCAECVDTAMRASAEVSASKRNKLVKDLALTLSGVACLAGPLGLPYAAFRLALRTAQNHPVRAVRMALGAWGKRETIRRVLRLANYTKTAQGTINLSLGVGGLRNEVAGPWGADGAEAIKDVPLLGVKALAESEDPAAVAQVESFCQRWIEERQPATVLVEPPGLSESLDDISPAAMRLVASGDPAEELGVELLARGLGFLSEDGPAAAPSLVRAAHFALSHRVGLWTTEDPSSDRAGAVRAAFEALPDRTAG